MGAAVLISFIPFQSVLGRLWPTPNWAHNPVLTNAYSLPSPAAKVDKKLIVGGLLFGAGWGITGMCPGPALVSLASTAGPQVVAYLLGMVMGMASEHAVSDTLFPSPPAAAAAAPVPAAGSAAAKEAAQQQPSDLTVVLQQAGEKVKAT